MVWPSFCASFTSSIRLSSSARPLAFNTALSKSNRVSAEKEYGWAPAGFTGHTGQALPPHAVVVSCVPALPSPALSGGPFGALPLPALSWLAPPLPPEPGSALPVGLEPPGGAGGSAGGLG